MKKLFLGLGLSMFLAHAQHGEESGADMAEQPVAAPSVSARPGVRGRYQNAVEAAQEAMRRSRQNQQQQRQQAVQNQREVMQNQQQVIRNQRETVRNIGNIIRPGRRNAVPSPLPAVSPITPIVN